MRSLFHASQHVYIYSSLSKRFNATMHLYMFSYRGPHVWIWYGLCTSSLTLSYQCGLPISVGLISLSLHISFIFFPSHIFSSTIPSPLLYVSPWIPPHNLLNYVFLPFNYFFLFVLVFPLLSSSPIIHLYFILLSINPFSFLSHFLIPLSNSIYVTRSPLSLSLSAPFHFVSSFFCSLFLFPIPIFPIYSSLFHFLSPPFYPLPSWTPCIPSLACLLCLSFINSFPSFSCFFKHIYILFPSLTNFNTTWNDAYH